MKVKNPDQNRMKVACCGVLPGLISGLSKVASLWQKSPPTLSYQPASLLASLLEKLHLKKNI